MAFTDYLFLRLSADSTGLRKGKKCARQYGPSAVGDGVSAPAVARDAFPQVSHRLRASPARGLEPMLTARTDADGYVGRERARIMRKVVGARSRLSQKKRAFSFSEDTVPLLVFLGEL